MPARSSILMSIDRGKKFESLGDALRDRHTENVGNIQQEQNRLRSGAGSAVQQKFLSPGGGSFSRNLEQTLRRGKARQGIINRGDASIRNQQLKDRLSLARQSVTRRGQLQDSAVNAERIRTGLETSERDSRDRVSQAFAGAGGFVAGSAVRGFGDNLFNSDRTVPVETDQGTASADFFNGSDLESFDFDTIGSGSFGGSLDA